MLFRSVDVSQVKQQSQAQGQASQQQAIDQMKQTAATNAATSAADTQLAAQVKAEKQKPEFQQDKGMLRRAAARGTNESKKENSKKVRVWGKK